MALSQKYILGKINVTHCLYSELECPHILNKMNSEINSTIIC